MQKTVVVKRRPGFSGTEEQKIQREVCSGLHPRGTRLRVQSWHEAHCVSFCPEVWLAF